MGRAQPGRTHASNADRRSADPAELLTWPPEGAVTLDTEHFYEGHAALGYYLWGPAFRSLRAAWTRGTDLFAEVRFPEGVNAGRFDLHPAFLDASLHALGLDGISDKLTGLLHDRGTETERPRIPFVWHGVQLHGRGSRHLRVRMSPSPTNPDGFSLTLADETGRLIATVDLAITLPGSRWRS